MIRFVVNCWVHQHASEGPEVRILQSKVECDSIHDAVEVAKVLQEVGRASTLYARFYGYRGSVLVPLEDLEKLIRELAENNEEFPPVTSFAPPFGLHRPPNERGFKTLDTLEAKASTAPSIFYKNNGEDWVKPPASSSWKEAKTWWITHSILTRPSDPKSLYMGFPVSKLRLGSPLRNTVEA